MSVPKAILVTGGAGFIGSNFVRYCLSRGVEKVINLDALTYAGNLDNLASVPAGHVFVQGDICDRALVSRLLTEHQPQALVNFAAESHVDRSIDSPGAFVRTNVVGTFELLEAARAYLASRDATVAKAFRFLHVSTDEVFGSLGASGRFTETSRYAPNSPYSASKAGADHFVRAYFETYKLPTLITNCSNNYGPYQFPEKLIPVVTLNALEGRDLPVYGDGQNIRDWLHVEDHCAALLRVLEAGTPGETYNVGGDSERTNLGLVETICDLLEELRPSAANGALAGRGGYRSLIRFVTDRPGHDRRYAIDSARLQSTLGWKPAWTLDRGLRQTLSWYLDNQAWCTRVASGAYRRERLGLSTVNAEARQ